MIKGVAKQVIVVRSPNPKLFEQAIFLIRDDALNGGGITERALLEEASKACAANPTAAMGFSNLLWAICGAGAMGLLWAISLLIG